MSITIISSRYANAENSAAEIVTTENGSILVSPETTPDLWQAMLAAGTPTAFSEAAAVRKSVSRAQAKIWLHRAGKLAAVQAHIDAANDPELTLWWNEATTFQIDHPYIVALAAGFQIDLPTAFTEAAAIG